VAESEAIEQNAHSDGAKLHVGTISLCHLNIALPIQPSNVISKPTYSVYL